MKSKTTLKTIMLPIAILFLVLSSCIDEYNRFSAYEDNSLLDNFFRTVQSYEEKVIIDNQSISTIYTEHNAVITIPANAFADLNGNVVSGEVEFTYLDIIDQSLIMLYHVPTISSGEMIESAGVFRLSAQQSGVELQLVEKIKIQLPSENPVDDMRLFYGEESENDQFDWQVVSSTGSELGWEQVTINEWNIPDSLNGFGFGYEFLVDSLTWINCDRFSNIPEDEQTSVCVSLPDEFTNKNTAVYIVFNDIKSVIGLYGDPQKMLFCDSYESCPVGYGVTFVVISSREDGTYRLGIKETVLEKDHEESIELEEKTIQEILDILGMF